MPQPDYSQVHINAPLTDLSVAYQQDARNYIADQVFPQVPVEKQGDIYYEYLLEDWVRSQAVERAPASQSAGSGWDLTNHTYYARLYAIHKDIDDQTVQNADSVFNLQGDATRWVTQQLLLKRDLDFVTNYLNTGIWATDWDHTEVPGGHYWSDPAGTPIIDVLTAGLNIGGVTGFKPNVLVLGAYVYTQLLNSPDIIERIKYSGTMGFATEQILAQAFDVERIVVSRAVANTAPKGATPVIDYIFGKSALLVYAPPAPGLLIPSGGYIFSWTGLLGAGSFGTRIKSFRMEELEATRIEGESAYDMHLVGADLGLFFTDIVT